MSQASSDPFELWWHSADGQGLMPMGEYDTRDRATAALDGAAQEMLHECADEHDRKECLAGTWHITVHGKTLSTHSVRVKHTLDVRLPLAMSE